jgi:hypothetical protein
LSENERNKKMKLSWDAPIIPSESIAGVNIGLKENELNEILLNYVVDKINGLYKLEKSPVLELSKIISVERKLYLFNVHDKELTNWRNFFSKPNHSGANPRALAISLINGIVNSVKVWHFEKLKVGQLPKNIYRGKLPGDFGLNDVLLGMSNYVNLTYDENENSFYSDRDYGAVEIGSYGDREDYPDQVIMSIAVNSGDAFS